MTNSINTPVALPALRKTARTILLGATVLALAGCKHDENQGKVAGWALVDPAQRHPITISQQPEVMSLHVSRGSGGLSPQQRAQVLGFADSSRAGDAGNSRLIIAAPSGTANEVAAMSAVGEIRSLLSDRGFSENSIQVEAYRQEGGGDAPIKVSYMRYVAEGPQCGHWSENLAYSPNNLPHPNLGCANQHNLAAMVANPADLLGPRTQSDRYGPRRDAVFEKYTKGDSSGTKRTNDERINTTKQE